MSLVIRVPKSEIPKVDAVKSDLENLIEIVKHDGEDLIYFPLSGKLLDMVKLLFRNDIAYVLQPAP